MTFRSATLSGPGGDLVLSTDEDWSGPVVWLLQDVVGWYGGVGVTDGGPQRSLGHGMFPQRRRRTARAITLTGSLKTRKAIDRDALDRFVSGLLWDGEPGTLTVVHGDSVLSTTVELEGEVQHKYEGTRKIALQVMLSAPDPFLYAPPQSTTVNIPGAGEGLKWGSGLFEAGFLRWGGSVPPARMENTGNAEAWPVFTVRGNFPEGFALKICGRAVEYPGAVTATAPVRVDYGSGQVSVNGRDVTHLLVRRQWVPIPPGGAVVPTLSPRSKFSEGWADASWSDTYI